MAFFRRADPSGTKRVFDITCLIKQANNALRVLRAIPNDKKKSRFVTFFHDKKITIRDISFLTKKANYVVFRDIPTSNAANVSCKRGVSCRSLLEQKEIC